VVVCLDQGANDLHIIKLMPLPPHRLLLHWNPDWCNLSGAGLPWLLWPLTRCLVRLSDCYISFYWRWRADIKGPTLWSSCILWWKNERWGQSLFGVRALSFLQCFDTVGWVTWRISDPWETFTTSPKVLFWNKWWKKIKGKLADARSYSRLNRVRYHYTLFIIILMPLML